MKQKLMEENKNLGDHFRFKKIGPSENLSEYGFKKGSNMSRSKYEYSRSTDEMTALLDGEKQ